jgi:uncharacterized membrane protein YfcA
LLSIIFWKSKIFARSKQCVENGAISTGIKRCACWLEGFRESKEGVKMFEFLGGALAGFILCLFWVGGYVVDFVIWLVSKLVPPSAATTVGIVIGIVGVIAGIFVAFSVQEAGAVGGGVVVGIGLYMAAFTPKKVRQNAEKKAAEMAERAKQQ